MLCSSKPSFFFQSEGAGQVEGAELQEKVVKEAKGFARALLGGRFIIIIVGGAPSGEELRAFLQTLCPPFGMCADGYGTTEVGVVCMLVSTYVHGVCSGFNLLEGGGGKLPPNISASLTTHPAPKCLVTAAKIVVM